MSALRSARGLAEQALSRAAGAPLSLGNSVEPLIDARANFDAWLEAIAAARRRVLLENYMVRDDEIGRAVRDALVERAHAGVRVCVIRDWFGCLGLSGDGFWAPLRAAGGEVRTYNPPRLDSPFGWVNRDHRKMLVADGEGFLSGVCVSAKWLGDPSRGIEPWRDTGVSVRGPAVADLVSAFAEIWAELGAPLDAPAHPETSASEDGEKLAVGRVALRIIATRPSTAGVFRLDQMIASLARHTLWLTDAYFVGVAPYTRMLAAAARDGVDVRVLVPGSSDIPVVAALSRGGYRPLLEAGVRVFEWNGAMLHAKTAVADGRWARIGSSNLNLASWMGNCELDVAIEDEDFARQMEAQYRKDLEHATEVVLPRRWRWRRRGLPRARGVGSGRATASAVRLASTVGAALTRRRVLGDAESGVLFAVGIALVVLAAIAALWPKVLAWPLAVVLAWISGSLFLHGWRLRRRARKALPPPVASEIAESERAPSEDERARTR